MRVRSVAIQSGIWRCGNNGRSSGSITDGVRKKLSVIWNVNPAHRIDYFQRDFTMHLPFFKSEWAAMQKTHGIAVFLRLAHNPSAGMRHYHLTREPQMQIRRKSDISPDEDGEYPNEDLNFCFNRRNEPECRRCLRAGHARRVPATSLRRTSIR
jgi:hypothetical protein